MCVCVLRSRQSTKRKAPDMVESPTKRFSPPKKSQSVRPILFRTSHISHFYSFPLEIKLQGLVVKIDNYQKVQPRCSLVSLVTNGFHVNICTVKWSIKICTSMLMSWVSWSAVQLHSYLNLRHQRVLLGGFVFLSLQIKLEFIKPTI